MLLNWLGLAVVSALPASIVTALVALSMTGRKQHRWPFAGMSGDDQLLFLGVVFGLVFFCSFVALWFELRPKD